MMTLRVYSTSCRRLLHHLHRRRLLLLPRLVRVLSDIGPRVDICLLRGIDTLPSLITQLAWPTVPPSHLKLTRVPMRQCRGCLRLWWVGHRRRNLTHKPVDKIVVVHVVQRRRRLASGRALHVESVLRTRILRFRWGGAGEPRLLFGSRFADHPL